ncbi:hypothetical protein LK429_11490 [Hoylesella buccalis]|uniref:Uncharacterized protein n=1 Tax=Hoylesella buccalis ATCC 35310 TaxID=679190 RepID=D1W549_9BACT|nr:hypothetical protein [Hoylesella buccalis]EFA92250.1 hypothetical protein HMPREF0650_0713 [Hoylesella buccalis ATCC 35310]MCB6902625.1 hypothetical protein [Hoylesella buccalis]UEA62654.1 hypothetical protein LK429_11490 [Hoylesella buccalis]UWP50060.1 hypothetical protein NQ518_03140 [Hoylesella buccalis ATCC 35310]
MKTAVMRNFKYILISFLLTFSMNCAAQHANGVTTTKPYGGVSYAAMFNGDLDCRNSIMAGLTWRSGC